MMGRMRVPGKSLPCHIYWRLLLYHVHLVWGIYGIITHGRDALCCHVCNACDVGGVTAAPAQLSPVNAKATCHRMQTLPST